MADFDKPEGGKHSWRLSPWSGTGSPKSKRSKRWILARHSPPASNDPTESFQDHHIADSDYRRNQGSSGDYTYQSQSSGVESPRVSNMVPEIGSPVSDDIRLLSLSKKPTYPAANNSYPELDNMSPVTPPKASENFDGPSGGTISRGSLSRVQTRFREELSDVDANGDLEEKYSRPPVDCSSIHDPSQSRNSEFAVAFWFISLFSTIGSLIWLIAAIYQPRWGRLISSGEHSLNPSTASLVTALLAKLIETTFVAVFVASVGQILTKRAFDRKSKGMTLAEISMRNWVIQPGLMITDAPAVRVAAFSILGLICLAATTVGILYTTASDALVSPKLRYGKQEQTTLQSYAMASYANLPYIRDSCVIPGGMDSFSNDACLAVSLAGASYHNIQTFMSAWHDAPPQLNSSGIDIMKTRPPATSILFDNTTMTAAWIETEHSDPRLQFQTHKRIVNNVTLAIPHPGVYLAATNPINNILQPNDLSGVGEYEIRASAVSPTVNVLCANVNATELMPLVYTTWPEARIETETVPGRPIPMFGWSEDIPVFSEDEWLNRTVLDDLFRWGPRYGRRPPVFPIYPMEYNLINNATVYMSDSFYVLGKSHATQDYTLCELRSWLSPKCSTEFNISGTTGAHLRAHCEDPQDEMSYSKHVPEAPNNETSGDWRNLADEWNLALYMNSGIQSANASRDRILTQLILTEPSLSSSLPSFAEALAVLVSSTLISGSLYTSLGHIWDQPTTTVPPPGIQQTFQALMRNQEYTSSHNADWQAVFYVVLFGVFALNCLCLAHFTFTLKGRPLADYTDPPNLFALAINSPPSERLKGYCGGRLNSGILGAPFGIGYSEAANHYYFEEREQQEKGVDYQNQWGNSSKTTIVNKTDDDKRKSGVPSSNFPGSPASDTMMSDDLVKGDRNEMGDEESPGPGRSYERLSNTRSWL